MKDNKLGLGDSGQSGDQGNSIADGHVLSKPPMLEEIEEQSGTVSIPLLDQFDVDDVNVSASFSGKPTGALLQIPITVRVLLGTAKLPLSKVMALGPGSVIVLDQKISDPAVLKVNGNELARGTIVVTDEATGQLGITITQIMSDSVSIPKPFVS